MQAVAGARSSVASTAVRRRSDPLGTATRTQARFRGRRPRGFTLLEILLALALIGLLSAALVSGAIRLTDAQPRRPEDVFWAASNAARRAAVQSEHEVSLAYESKEKRFVVRTAAGGSVPFPIPSAKRDLSVDLLQGQVQRGAGSVLIGGQLVDTRTIPSATYYPDGTCTPFRVQFHTDGPAVVLAIDPWTCAPVLEREEQKTR